MKRRDFAKMAGLASLAWSVPLFAKPLSALSLPPGDGFKRLVLLQLNGGNDGLNTFVPFEDDHYYKLRPKVALEKSKIIPLQNGMGLNQAAEPLKRLFDNGDLTIINNVGYPEPVLSHFRSMDIWHTASNASENIISGWLGRLLDHEYLNNPMPGIEIDADVSRIFMGENRMGFGFSEPRAFLQSVAQQHAAKINAIAANHKHDEKASYMYRTLIQANESAKFVETKLIKNNRNKSNYPSSAFATQLKTIADLMVAGAQTRVYFIDHNSYDTHFNQQSNHARLLGTLSGALEAFVQNLKEQKLWNETLIMVFSEFGRRASENGSSGTDHGSANNVMILSGKLKKQGFLNENPNLGKLDKDGNLLHTIDFRQIYATLLNNWLGVDDKRVLLNRSFNKLNFI